MAERGTTLMLYISEEEKERLVAISEATERDMSKMVRFLINREYAALFPAAEMAASVPCADSD